MDDHQPRRQLFYEALTGHNSFRVLQLAPGSRDEPLTCRLVHVSLDDNDDDDDDDDENTTPAYEAVSYTWGDSSTRHTLHCGGGSELLITENAWSVLLQLRHTQTARYLWVDAICINQADHAERSQQVRIMRHIYRRAVGVLVWLGPEAENSEAAMAMVASLSAATRRLTRRKTSVVSPRLTGVFDGLHDMQALYALLNRPWFQRVWVVQEVAVARRVQVLCGRAIVEWEDLVCAADELARSVLSFGYVNVLSRSVYVDLARLLYHEEGRKPSSLHYLSQFRTWEATDPRDKVFSIIGLLDPDDTLASEELVRYTSSTAEIFRRVAIRIIRAERNLDLLAAVDPPEKNAGMPSWVPDWRVTVRRSPIVPLELPRGAAERDYNASKTDACQPRLSQRDDLLGVRGHLLDRVAEVSSVYPERQVIAASGVLELNDDNIRLMYLYLQLFKAFATMTKPLAARRRTYPTGETYLDARWRTLKAGWMHDFGERPPRFRVYEIICTLYRLFAYLHLHGFRFAADRTLRLVSRLIGSQRFTEVKDETLAAVQFRLPINRRFVVTERGYIGLVPARTEVGDRVALFAGSRTPLIVREGGAEETLEFIGCAYVHGIMHGEAWDKSRCRDYWLK